MQRLRAYLERKEADLIRARRQYETAERVHSNLFYMKSKSDAEIRLHLNNDHPEELYFIDRVYRKLIGIEPSREIYDPLAIKLIKRQTLSMAGRIRARRMAEHEYTTLLKASPEEIMSSIMETTQVL